MPMKRIKGEIFFKSLNSKVIVDDISMKLFLKTILYRLRFVESLGHFVYFFLLCNYNKNVYCAATKHDAKQSTSK